MTRAQDETLLLLQQAGSIAGETCHADLVLPRQDAQSIARRRTLITLHDEGYLGNDPGLEDSPAWVSNVYTILPDTYERAAQYAAQYA
jgi:hypothetical protein